MLILLTTILRLFLAPFVLILEILITLVSISLILAHFVRHGGAIVGTRLVIIGRYLGFKLEKVPEWANPEAFKVIHYLHKRNTRDYFFALPRVIAHPFTAVLYFMETGKVVSFAHL